MPQFKDLLAIILLALVVTSCGNKKNNKNDRAFETSPLEDGRRSTSRLNDSTQKSITEQLSALENQLEDLGVRAIAYPHVKRYLGWRIRGHRVSNSPNWWQRSCDKSMKKALIQNDKEIKTKKKFLFLFKFTRDVKEKCLPKRYIVPNKKYCKRLKSISKIGVTKNQKFLSQNELADIREVAKDYLKIAREYSAQSSDDVSCLDRKVVAKKVELLEEAFGLRIIEEDTSEETE